MMPVAAGRAGIGQQVATDGSDVIRSELAARAPGHSVSPARRDIRRCRRGRLHHDNPACFVHAVRAERPNRQNQCLRHFLQLLTSTPAPWRWDATCGHRPRRSPRRSGLPHSPQRACRGSFAHDLARHALQTLARKRFRPSRQSHAGSALWPVPASITRFTFAISPSLTARGSRLEISAWMTPGTFSSSISSPADSPDRPARRCTPETTAAQSLSACPTSGRGPQNPGRNVSIPNSCRKLANDKLTIRTEPQRKPLLVFLQTEATPEGGRGSAECAARAISHNARLRLRHPT